MNVDINVEMNRRTKEYGNFSLIKDVSSVNFQGGTITDGF